MATYNAKGQYKAAIYNAYLATAKTGTQQLVFELDLLEYNNKGKWEKPLPTRFPPTIYLSLTDKTLGNLAAPGWVANLLKTLGFDGNFDNIAQLAGLDVNVTCNSKINQSGQEVEDWMIDSPRTPPPPPEKKALSNLNRQFGKIFQKQKQPAQPTQNNKAPVEQTQPVNQSPPSNDDNDPF